MKTIRSLTLTLSVFLLCGTAASLKASNIQWGSAYNDLLYDSLGVELDGSFEFQAGVFVSGFTPTLANMGLWEANWRVFDSLSEGLGWSSADQEFAGSASLLPGGFSSSSKATPGYSFTEGQKTYFWVFNSKSITSGTEWALVSDSNPLGNLGSEWAMPAPATGNTYQWLLLDADTAVIGGVNDAQGGGGPPPVLPGSYSLQTYSVVAVPEPGSALLAAVSGVWTLRRRRNRAK